MASTSTSYVQKSFKYDVFLSFRGEDTRKNFVDHLYLALDNKGIITYKDDEKIEKGERIDEQLIRSIEESRFYIIVFSNNYASSSWCLDELVKIMECQKSKEHTAYSVFYDVEPTEVRNQSGSVGEAFAKHEKEESTRKMKRTLADADLENEDDVSRWRNAMTEAAGLDAIKLKNTFNGNESKFIQNIVVEISHKLSLINEDLVGMEPRVEKIVSSLEIGSKDVRVIGIWGMGGSGKTTLARAVFDHISIWFEGRSFVENVREGSKGSSGLKGLQKQILSAVLNDKSIDVTSVSEAKDMMKMRMHSRKVLIVLDDVDDIEQLEALAGKPNWFKSGSRIIITTRDEQVLIAHGVHSDDIHPVNLLSDEDAICLFRRLAFKKDIPIQGYEWLSLEVIRYAVGLPLTIKVLGSHLCGRSELERADAKKRLKRIPLKETVEKLEISYDGLEDDHKEIFLDVACLLKGYTKDEAIRVLESCGYHAEICLRVLEQKSLISISNIDCLQLHDHIEEMGKNIVRRLYCEEPSNHSRLWNKEEIEAILVYKSGTEATKSIKLLSTHLSPDIIMKGLTKMKQLRFLHVDNGYKNDVYASPSSYNYASLPNALQYIYWRGYPLSCLPETFHAHKLVSLEMPHSSISQLWEMGERKVLNKIRFLNLSFSKLRTLDLGLTPHLERLDLRGCNDLVELLMPFECSKLKFLDLSGSTPSNLNLGLTPNLEVLYLEECNDFVEFHIPVECPKLKLSNLGASKVSNLNLGLLLRKLECQENLSLTIKDITNLPDSIYMLKHLKYLELKSCWFLEQLPKDLDRLECLKELHIMDCTSLRDIPKSICNMKCLEYLHLPYCSRVKKLPEEIGSLECLKELNIEGTGISQLPQSIFQLKGLRIVWSRGRLELYGFTSLKEISRYTASSYIS